MLEFFTQCNIPAETFTQKKNPNEKNTSRQRRTHAILRLYALRRSRRAHNASYSRPFFLEVDASQYATGAILTQKDEHNRLRPIGNVSHALTPAERNYDVHNRELLAVIRGLRAWRHIFLSSPFEVTVFTDHANLQYYRHPQRLGRPVA